MVVRFEVDACIPQRTNPAPTSDIDALTDALLDVSLSSTAREKERSTKEQVVDGLCIRQAGSYVPQKNIMELTTISKWRLDLFDWSEAYPQLFLSQTPHHYLAVHDRGGFTEVIKRKLGSSDEEMQAATEAAQVSLQQLRQALGTIQNIVVEQWKDGRLSLVFQNGELKVYERVSQASCLPEHILKKFEV